MSESVAHFDATDNPFVRSYSSRAILTKRGFEKANRGDPVFSPTFELVLAIPGVASIYGTAYELVVARGERFSWDEVHPRVLEILMLANAEMASKRDLQ